MTKIKLLIALVLLAYSGFAPSFANAADPKKLRQLESKIKEVSRELVPAFKNEVDYIFNHRYEYKIRFEGAVKDFEKECLEITRRMPRANDTSRIRYYQIETHKDCLANSKTPWFENLNREYGRWWFKNLPNKFKGQLISMIYTQKFFYLHRSYSLDFEQNIQDLVADTFVLMGKAVIKGRTLLSENHADVSRVADAVLFDRQEDFAKISEIPVGESEAKFPLIGKLKMIYEPNDAWFIRYHMIKNAKKSIRVQSYSLFDDLHGRAFVALLLQALERGVQVHMMLDGRGSITTSRSDLVELLVLRGAKVSSYNPLMLSTLNIGKFFRGGLIGGLVSSNHDKILLVDDTKLLTGGRNIGTRYFVYPEESNEKAYQDLDVYAECESFPVSAVAAFNIEFYSGNSINVSSIFARKKKAQQVFSALQTIERMMNNRPLRDSQKAEYPQALSIRNLGSYASFDPVPEEEYHLIEGLDKTSMLMGENALTDEIFRDIEEAQESIMMINPYVILTSGMKKRLVEASKRGVKISIVTTSPTSTDSQLTQARLISEWKDLLREIPTLSLYGSRGPGKLHAKAFIFDSKIALIGSYNLDGLSELMNSEFALKVNSPEFVRDIEEFYLQFIDDQTLKYDLERNIGPHSQPNGESNYRKMKRLRFITWALRPIL